MPALRKYKYGQVYMDIRFMMKKCRRNWMMGSGFWADAAYVTVQQFPYGSEMPEDKQITKGKWQKIINKLYGELFLHEWRKEYVDPCVLDGTQWSLDINLTNRRVRHYYGSNDYHIHCYAEDIDPDTIACGSLLDSKTVDDLAVSKENLEANAFAGLLLMPDNMLDEQLKLYGIVREKISVDDVLTLMDLFALFHYGRTFEINDLAVDPVYSTARPYMPEFTGFSRFPFLLFDEFSLDFALMFFP